MMKFDLTGKHALVTGGSRGFGARIAQVLSENGAAVTIVGRDQAALETTAKQLKVKWVQADVRSVEAADLFETADAIERVYDILINNAGIGHAEGALDLPEKTWSNVLATDLSAPFFLAQEFASRLISIKREGVILNVASAFGITPTKAMAAYAAAKAGLISLTKSLAMELASKNIRVNAIAPGWCVTDMTRAYLESPRGASIAGDIPLGRFGVPSDLDGVVLLLVSDASRYITGATFVIDGGLSIAMRDGGKKSAAKTAAVEFDY